MRGMRAAGWPCVTGDEGGHVRTVSQALNIAALHITTKTYKHINTYTHTHK